MFRALILVAASLLLAQSVSAAPGMGGRGGAGSFGRGGGSFGRSSAPATRPSAIQRGGAGTLGQYQGRTPSTSHVPRSVVIYPGPFFYPGFYPDGYYDGFFSPSFYDPFFGPEYGEFSYGPGYGPTDQWSRRGNVQLHVDPKDVEVIVDGIPTARSGRAVLNLPTGTHHFEFVHPGYRPWTVDLNVQQGVRYRLEQKLERLSKEEQQKGEDQPAGRPAGELRLTVHPDGTIVQIDGRLLGMSDLLRGSEALRHLPLGRHTLRFSHPGYQTVEKEVDITADRPAEVSIDLQRE